MTNGYFSIDRFKLAIESRYFDDNGTTENALQMPADELKAREIIFVDVSDKGADVLPADEDVTAFHSNKRNIGPLAPGWYKESSRSFKSTS